VLFHDSITDAQSQAGPLADALRGVERLKDARRLFDTGARVLNLNVDPVVLGKDGHLHSALTRTLVPFFDFFLDDRIQAVVHDVQENLLQLMRIA